MTYSPLRYPGGKNKLSAFVAKICKENGIDDHYIEPYSGGASIGLFLLLEGYVKRITINDKDRSIYAFWYAVLNKTLRLCQMIEDAELTMAEWRRQKAIQKNKSKEDLLILGFSTFYLNRTNRSGIINAGVIGGNQQKGNYLIDCRFNKADLIRRIKRIAKERSRINLYKKDAIKLIEKTVRDATNKNLIFYFDPPYYFKSYALYMNHYSEDDHKRVSEKIKSIKNIPWIVSYDNVEEIQKLFSDCAKKEFSFKHTVNNKKEGKEIMFFSPGLLQPEIENYNPVKFRKDKISSKIIYPF